MIANGPRKFAPLLVVTEVLEGVIEAMIVSGQLIEVSDFLTANRIRRKPTLHHGPCLLPQRWELSTG